MSPRQRITSVLKEWLDLTHVEAQAIQAARWSALARVQKAKAALETPLGEALDHWKSASPEDAASSPLCDEICRLLVLESHHSGLLAVRKREVREKMLLLEQALYDLKHLHTSGSPTPKAA